MSTIKDLTSSIARMEGYGPTGNRATRNNNPGNLRASSLAIGKDKDGFAIFPSPEVGWAALERQVNLDAGRGLSLAEFIGKYAPNGENDTQGYLGNISSWLGVNVNTPLRDLVSGGTSAYAFVPYTPTYTPSYTPMTEDILVDYPLMVEGGGESMGGMDWGLVIGVIGVGVLVGVVMG